jgi:hypothetical protein
MCDALRVVMGRRLDIHKILHAWLCYDTILQFSVKRIEIDLDKHFKTLPNRCDVCDLPCLLCVQRHRTYAMLSVHGHSMMPCHSPTPKLPPIAFASLISASSRAVKSSPRTFLAHHPGDNGSSSYSSSLLLSSSSPFLPLSPSLPL